MTEVTLARERPGHGGATPTRTALSASNTYKVRNDGNTYLSFLKTGAGDATITVTTPATLGGLAVADVTFTVGATTGDVMAGPFAPGIFNDGAGDLEFATDEDTGITCAVIGA